jgi:hypothetical protein
MQRENFSFTFSFDIHHVLHGVMIKHRKTVFIIKDQMLFKLQCDNSTCVVVINLYLVNINMAIVSSVTAETSLLCTRTFSIITGHKHSRRVESRLLKTRCECLCSVVMEKVLVHIKLNFQKSL